MGFKKLVGAVVTFLALSIFLLGDVNAAAISVKCTVTGASRSSVSVVGTGLSGNNYVIVGSGGRGYKSGIKTAGTTGVLVFNFDSNPAAIAAGATPIPATFIKNLRVEGFIRKAVTHRWIAAIAANCTAK
ncbi:MAG: hypothetical protein HOP36_02685 [Methyloglobulus sp.]|nr:hypothetical protein [Methyloglobulus sp.]